MIKILLKMLVVILAVGLLVTSMEASSNESDEYSYSKFTTGGSSTNIILVKIMHLMSIHLHDALKVKILYVGQ